MINNITCLHERAKCCNWNYKDNIVIFPKIWEYGIFFFYLPQTSDITPRKVYGCYTERRTSNIEDTIAEVRVWVLFDDWSIFSFWSNLFSHQIKLEAWSFSFRRHGKFGRRASLVRRWLSGETVSSIHLCG